MVRVMYISLILLLLPATLTGAKLSIEVDDDRVEIGKYLNARIVYEGESIPGRANLNKWVDDFHIEHGFIESQNQPNNQIQTIEKLRLYPRQQGEYTLHSIALGGAIAKPVKIQVMDSIRNGINATPKWSDLPATIWQGESITTCINIKMFDSGNTFKVDDADLPGFSIIIYPSKIQTVEGIKHFQQCWKITALNNGIYKISMPAIHQRGRGRWKYYLPHQTLEVLPLPAYIPPAVPIGKPVIKTKLSLENQTPYWQVIATIENNINSEIHGLRAALASIANRSVDDVSFESIPLDNGLKQQQVFKVALPNWLRGYGKGPELTVRYFDVEKGILSQEKNNLPAAWRVPNWFKTMLIMTLGIVFLYVAQKIFQWIRKFICRLKFKNMILHAEDSHHLRHLLLNENSFNERSSNSSCKSLQQWAENCGHDMAYDIANRLNEACFSSIDSCRLQEIKASLVKYI